MGPDTVMEPGTPRSLLISGLEHANLIALLARRFAKDEMCLAVTTHAMVSFKISHRTRTAVRTLPTMMRVLYRTADVLVAVADAVAANPPEITGVPKESINIIHNPVDAHEILERSRETGICPGFARCAIRYGLAGNP